jgi:hypothetical protein
MSTNLSINRLTIQVEVHPLQPPITLHLAYELWTRWPCPTGFHILNQVLARGLLIAMMMEAVSTSETSVNFYQATRRNIPEHSHLILAAVRTWNLALSSSLRPENKFAFRHFLLLRLFSFDYETSLLQCESLVVHMLSMKFHCRNYVFKDDWTTLVIGINFNISKNLYFNVADFPCIIRSWQIFSPHRNSCPFIADNSVLRHLTSNVTELLHSVQIFILLLTKLTNRNAIRVIGMYWKT